MPAHACRICGRITQHPRCPDHPAPQHRGPSSIATRQPSWRKTRQRILNRDHHVCQLCGKPGADSVDHIQPVSRGGTDDDANLQAAHMDCNRIKGWRGTP